MSDDYLVSLQAIVQGAPTASYDAVAEAYIGLIASHPARVEAYQSLALYAGLCGQWAAAHHVIDEALQLATGRARSFYIKARIGDEALDPQGAIRDYEQALQLDPGQRPWRFNLGLAQLTLGDFEQGCVNYRHRHTDRDLQAVAGTPAWALQNGDLRVLIWAEQGLGDELMFTRLLPCLKAYACRFTLQCDARLISTFRLNHPDLEFLPRGELAPLLHRFDAQIALGELMTLFHRELGGPLVRDAVLKPVSRPDVDALLQRRPASRLHVGLNWLSMNAEYGAQRSLPLDRLLDAFTPARHVLVNLQYLAPPEQLQAIRQRGFELIDSVNAFEDVEGLAALAARCDALVSIDNSTLHLAGALGLKALALIPRMPNWRWQLHTPHSAWYPSLELIRQTRPLDWSAELSQLRQRFSPDT